MAAVFRFPHTFGHLVGSGIRLLGQIQRLLTVACGPYINVGKVGQKNYYLWSLVKKVVSPGSVNAYWHLCLSSCLSFSSVTGCLHWVQGIWRHDDHPDLQLHRHRLCWQLLLLQTSACPQWAAGERGERWMDGWVEGPIPFKCVLLLNNYLQVKWHKIFENPSWCGRVNLIYISQYYKSHPLSLETIRKTSLLKGKQMKETSGNRTFSMYRTDLQQEMTVYAVIMFLFKIFFLHFTFIWRGWEGGSHAAKVASQIQPGGLL